MLRIRFGKDDVTVTLDLGPNLAVMSETYSKVEVEYQRPDGFWLRLDRPVLRAMRLAAKFSDMVGLFRGDENKEGQS